MCAGKPISQLFVSSSSSFLFLYDAQTGKGNAKTESGFVHPLHLQGQNPNDLNLSSHAASY